MDDPAKDLCLAFLRDVTSRQPGLRAYLLAKSRDLPRDPEDAEAVLKARWPQLTDEERREGFIAARNVLLSISDDCILEAELLERFTAVAGNG